MRTFFFFAVLSVCAGCASSHVLVGTPRPAISPSQVKLYLQPPSKYEQIAMVDASSKGSFAITQQGKMDKAIERLKEEAAKLGANGVLLQGSGSEYGATVGTATVNGNFGTGIGVPVMHKAASGIAIYVPSE